MTDTPVGEHERVRALASAATVGEIVTAMTAAFRAASLDTPALDARRLTEHKLGLAATDLLRDPGRRLTSEERSRLVHAASRRLAREPVSRIVGERAFHGLDLEIGPATLDPRPDTETLVDGILALVAEGAVPGGDAPRILDLGTGSGAILLALLTHLPSARGLGTDISPEALEVAGRNARRLGLADRVRLAPGRWLDGIRERFEIVVSNPPYIPAAEIDALEPEVARFDPRGALDGGPDGLDAYREIARGLPGVLVPGGWTAVEVGAGQSEPVARILASSLGTAPCDMLTWTDLGGIARCVAVKARA
ncbi:MAG: peptide chain release factor N(5)-glutamine methyltransferase [Hyphomicrobiaceae bacterium]